MEFNLTEDQEMIKNLARDFTRKEIAPIADYYDKKAEFPHTLQAKARELGLINVGIPEVYGGSGIQLITTRNRGQVKIRLNKYLDTIPCLRNIERSLTHERHRYITIKKRQI